jgi:putative hydrolase of HD superfamily
VDIHHAVVMLLVHDLVEIVAGDTFIYDEMAVATQKARELEAADRIFGLLPHEQGTAPASSVGRVRGPTVP